MEYKTRRETRLTLFHGNCKIRTSGMRSLYLKSLFIADKNLFFVLLLNNPYTKPAAKAMRLPTLSIKFISIKSTALITRAAA